MATRKYVVGFLEGDSIKQAVTVFATDKSNAYSKAEETYKKKRWDFQYNDMFCDLQPFL